MSFRNHVVHCIVCLAAATMAASPVMAAGPKIQAPGELTIMSLTNGAEVVIDGKPMGTIPLEDSLVLLPGKHTIKVTKRGYSEYTDTFNVRPGESVELEIDLLPFAGMVKIMTPEPGATVKIDGKVEGVTPFDKDLQAGKRIITISRADFQDEVRELEIRPGEAYELNILLRPVSKDRGDAGGEAFYETWWFWTIVGVAGAGAAAAAVATSSGDTITLRGDIDLHVR